MGRNQEHPREDIALAVKAMRSAGLEVDAITSGLKIGGETLYKYYKEELDFGKSETIAKIAEGVIHRAINGDNAAAFFYLKCQANWSERQLLEHTGKDGAALVVNIVRHADNQSSE